MQTPKTLILKVQSREGVLFDGEILTLTSKNSKGKYDILPMHNNFITLVDDKLLLRLPDGKQKELIISTGVMRVIDNKIDVFTGVW